MSHLPLDARAILHYLNELGYRNISAIQLKEFVKGMQPQSELDDKCEFKNHQQQSTTHTNRNTTARPTKSASILRENPTPTTAAASANEISKRSPAVKVVKCKKPLCHFKFYLDIRDHQLTKRIEDQIKLLGGSLEFFLSSSVTHFITDKPNIAPAVSGANSQILNINCPLTPQTPKTPLTPQTPYSLEGLADSTKSNNGLANKKTNRNSRADAILNRARRQSTLNVSTPTTRKPIKHNIDSIAEQTSSVTSQKHNPTSNDAAAPTHSYVVWQCENALRFFKKVQDELKDYLGHSNKTKNRSYAIEPITLKGGFIKFESVKRNNRPYYHLFKKPQEWPKIQLSREDGAFRLSPKKEFPPKELKEKEKYPEALNGPVLLDNMTRKSRAKTSQNNINLKNKRNDLVKSPTNSQRHSGKCKNQTPQNQKDTSDKQCGVCEICKIEYDALTIHLKTKDHEYFAKNSQNFMALDSLIHSSADVNKFLDENRKLEIKTELEEMEVDHEGIIIMEQDPLQNSENENDCDDDDDDDVEEDDDDDQSQKSSSTTKRKSVEPKISPTIREKSKRSTKGKHSSEKFQNCTPTPSAKSPKTLNPQKPLVALDIKTNFARRKPSSSAVISPPIRAMLPPSSMYKVVETHTEVNCTPPRGKGIISGFKGDSNIIGSPSIIVKFKKVRNTELEVLNGEAENFMFPKKRNDSSDLPTDVDRHTTSDRVQQTQSSQQVLSSSSDEEEQDPEDDIKVKRKPSQMARRGKKAIVKAKRRLSKINSSSNCKLTSGGEFKQSFRKTPIQPKEQLKSEKKLTTAITTMKRKSMPMSEKRFGKNKNVSAVAKVSSKIVLPEATRKSSRTATAIVTAATTSTRLLQAAVEAAKSKHKLETLVKSKLQSSLLPPSELGKPKKQIKQEIFDASEQEEDEHVDVLNNIKPRSNKLRCRLNKSVVKMEDRMGDIIKTPRNSVNERKFIHGFDVEDYEDDDVTIDDEEDDDEKDEDFTIQSRSIRNKLTPKSIKKTKDNISAACSADQISSSVLKPLLKKKRSTQAQMLMNLSVREERLARRQSRLITQLQLEFQTASEEEPCKELPKPKNVQKKPEKKFEKSPVGKSPTKTLLKLSKPETKKSYIKSTTKTTLPIKQEPTPAPLTCSAPSRYFDYKKSERIKAIRYAFESLPTADLWYHVYKRQDNCEEKYFEFFGSTKYRKLPYELGPIPLDTTLIGHNKQKMSCKLCDYVKLEKQTDKVKKMNVRDIKLSSNTKVSVSHNNTDSQKYNNCSSSSAQDKQLEQNNIIHDKDQDQKHSKLNSSSHSTETKSYAHKHKKLHLLQRYRQELEQQELLQRQKLEDHVKNACLTAGASELKREDVAQDCTLTRNDRAGSSNSNASSCTSSTHINCKSKKMRNKILNKVSFLANLELPPRKSPREHASTLALVSCIIKQRQDSLSKPNSETDEPEVTPVEEESKVLAMAVEKLRNDCDILENEPPKTPPPSARKKSIESPAPNVLHSPRTRSQAATPIEELRFATEISETVKRMRRGRNKYDYSPPFVQRMGSRPSSARGRGSNVAKSVVNLFGTNKKIAPLTSNLGSSIQQGRNNSNVKIQTHTAVNIVTKERRKRGRQKGYNKIQKNPENVLTSIRKTGSKKGVLEFDVDNIAIEALRKATTDYLQPKLLEWQIDKFLTLTNKEYGNDLLLAAANVTAPSEDNEETTDDADTNVQEIATPENTASALNDVVLNTPPVTDCFSSDFDLCDIINQSLDRLEVTGENATHMDRRIKKFSIFNTNHLNKYYRKRKNPKTNRTGWPKAPKKKAVTRQQSMQDKIYFLKKGNVTEEKSKQSIGIKKEMINDSECGNDDDSTQEQTRESGVITPPDSENEIDENEKQPKMVHDNCDDEEESLLMEEESQMVLNDDSQTCNEEDDVEEDDDCECEEGDAIVDDDRIIEEDEETLAESAVDDDGDDEDEEDEEDLREQKADSDADADIEEVDEEEHNTRRDMIQQKSQDKKLNKKCKKTIPKIIENDDEDSYEPQEKRSCILKECPVGKIQTNLLNANSTYISTPTTPFLRALRRTPQLNGSLGSCISPSEKAGDNSDIFTVSSDGLDTDMDNSQSQLRSANVMIDEEDHYHHHHHPTASLHNNSSAITPKRKFDITKYAPTNATICAAEAATAAVKSLAISQFLKKEVRVTCRRLRAPFRRFRYRR